MRWVGIALIGTLACGSGASDEGPCVERQFFRDIFELDRMAVVRDGYVLDGPGGLFGYGLDNGERFFIPGTFDAFEGARDGKLVSVSTSDGVVSVQEWSSSGAGLGELGNLQDPSAGLDPDDVAILSSGSVIAGGGAWRDWWVGHVAPDQPGVVLRSDQEQLSAIVPALGTDAYALRSTWHDDLGTLEHVELERIDANLLSQWKTTVYDRPDDTVPFETIALLASAGDDAFVVTSRDGGVAPQHVFRRYGPDGELLWSREEEQGGTAAPPGLPVVRADAELLWVRGTHSSIRVSFLDEAGDTLCEGEVPSDGQPVTDLAVIDDELFVVTVDRITRIRLDDVSENN